MRNRGHTMLLFAMMFVAGAGMVWAQKAQPAEAPAPAKGDKNVGLIFNIDNLPFGLTTYITGFGLKWGADAWAVRGLLSFNWSSSVVEGTVGTAYEYHLGTGAISPYLGANLGVGIIGVTQGTASAYVMPVHVGAIVGVEVFPLDFLSLFAEYELGADLQVSFGPPLSVNYLAKIGMGNNAQIGIVIWFSRKQGT